MSTAVAKPTISLKIELARNLCEIFADLELANGAFDALAVPPRSARWYLLTAARHLHWSLDVNRLHTIRQRLGWIVEATSYLAHHTVAQIEAGGLRTLTVTEFQQVTVVQNALALAQSILCEDIADLCMSKSRKLV